MKPDRSGTMTEQRMFRNNWKSKGEKGKQCRDCHHFELSFEKSSKGSPKCWEMNFRTSLTATCDKWLERHSQMLPPMNLW